MQSDTNARDAHSGRGEKSGDVLAEALAAYIRFRETGMTPMLAQEKASAGVGSPLQSTLSELLAQYERGRIGESDNQLHPIQILEENPADNG